MKKEEWKYIKFNKDYIVSSWGRVISLRNNKFLNSELLKSRSDFYFRINIAGTRLMLHWLVALHFKNPNKYVLDDLVNDRQLQVNHKDLNTLNCAAYNLEFCSQGENIKHSVENRLLNFNGKVYKIKRSKDD